MPIRRIACATAAVLLAACTSAPAEGGSETSQNPSSAASSIERAQIELLEISEPEWRADGGNWGLVLTWTSPPDVAVDHYVVRRDGVTIAGEVDGTRFIDEDAEPDARYRYEVEAVDAAGASTSTIEARIETAAPSRARARLDGSFLVRMVVRSSTGTRDPVRGGAILFAFEPVCRSGPCSVGWRIRRAETDGTLRRDGAVYAAMLRTPLFVRNCFGDLVDESLDVRFRVTRAAPVEGRWRATAIEGTIREVSSYGGCLTASIRWTVRGSLQT